MTRRWFGWLAGSKRFAAISSLIVAVVVLVSYYPSVRVGFLGDDWWFLGKAASKSLPDYLVFYFDPGAQIFWYRPLYGILLLIEYALFGSSPEGYHVVQLLLHLVNCLLLFVIVWRISKRWRLAWLAALFYAVLPVYSSAVFWVAVQDPLAMVFFLAAVMFWFIYLQSGKRWYYWLTFGAYVLALLGKETNFFLPMMLFLLDWWFARRTADKIALIRRYSPFIFVLLVYLLIEKQVQANAYFPNRWGYSLGFHVIENGLHYLALLAFPWELDPPASYLWLLFILVVLIAVGLKLRNRLFVLLGIATLLAIAPAVAFPTIFFSPRYLYAAAMVSAILMALFFEAVWTRSSLRPAVRVIYSVLAIVFVLLNSAQTSAMAESAVEYGRQSRVLLRDIYQQHPTYPPGTFLYFIEPPYPMIMRNLTGMFLLRYGSNVTVWSTDAEWGGVDENRFAGLREYKNSFVYYFDESKQRHEVVVDPSAQSMSSPTLPVNFQAPIRLEGYEVTSMRLKRESDLVLILYWKAKGWIGKDYTVFIHLINEKGETVLGEDSQPRSGHMPTTEWGPNRLVVDAHVLTIPPVVPPGKYRLEVGLYYLPTLERLDITDNSGRPIADKIVIEPFEIAE